MKRARIVVLTIALTAASGAAWIAKKIVGGPREVQQVEKTVGANPEDLIGPRGETPRSGERRDVVWGKYVNGEPTISKRAASEHANASEVSQIGGSQ